MTLRHASSLFAIALATTVGACGTSGPDAPPMSTYDASPGLTLPPATDASGVADAAVRDAARDVSLDAPSDAKPRADAQRDASDASVDAVAEAAPSVDAGYPAFPVDPPQVIDNMGAIVASPNFVPVVFTGETLAPSIGAFMSAVGASAYWSTIGTEYGVGPAISTSVVVDSYVPPTTTTDSAIQTWLANAIATDPRFLAVGASPDAGIQPSDPSAVPPDGTVYVLFYPAGVTINDGAGVSCTAFGGYHYDFKLGNGATVVYAVIPRCPGFDELNGIDEVTAVTSHELIEAATDPQTYTSPGWVGTDTDHFIWQLVLGNGEVGDMCSFLPNAFIHPADADLSPYVVQRMWSNQAAAAGQDPCVPSTGETAYWNSIPETTEVPFVDQGTTYQTLGTQIAVGTTATVTFDLFSTASSGGPWTVYLLDYGAAYDNPTILDIQAVGAAEGQNGNKVQFTIKPVSAGPSSLFGISPYFVYSENAAQTESGFWVGAVVN